MYYGKYRGTVKDVADPEQRGRIRVECKEIYDSALSPWALPCFSPNEFRIPRVGDIVWIEFERGAKQYPVWVGTVYTQAEVAARFLRGTAYSAGLVVEVADAGKQEYITGAVKEVTTGNILSTITGNITELVTGTITETITGNVTETTVGSRTETTTVDLTEVIGGNLTISN